MAVLCGLGGIGKSTTALAFAWRHSQRRDFPGSHGVLWVYAGGVGGLVAGLAHSLHLYLGIRMTAAEAANETEVRSRLQAWAARRHEPWLLVVDNLEPTRATALPHIHQLLGASGCALVTCRAGARVVSRYLEVPREAVHSMAYMDQEDAYTVMEARYRTAILHQQVRHLLGAGPPNPLPASERAAMRKLAEAVGGLPLAVEQVAALVGARFGLGETFASYLSQYTALVPASGALGKELPQLSRADSQQQRRRFHDDLFPLYHAGLAECRLDDVPGLVPALRQACDWFDDVQWLSAEDVGLVNKETPAKAARRQRRKWERFKAYCYERSADVQPNHTLSTVWKTQLKALPPHCVELLQAAACFAPHHIPLAAIGSALLQWLQAADSHSTTPEWLSAFAATSALVEKARQARDDDDDEGSTTVQAVLESALLQLEDLSLIHCGAWDSVDAIHGQLGHGVLRGLAATSLPWFSMHMLVQGVVLAGSGGSAAREAGTAIVVALGDSLSKAAHDMRLAFKGGVLDTSGRSGTMVLAAWLAAHDHATQVAHVVLPPPLPTTTTATSSSGPTAVAAQFARGLLGLTELVDCLGLHRQSHAWVAATTAIVAALRRHHGDADHAHVAEALTQLAMLHHSRDQPSEAEPLHLEALAMRRRLAGATRDSSEVTWSLNNIGLMYHALGRWEAAEEKFREALSMERRLAGGKDTEGLACYMNNLALVHNSRSRFGEAEAMYVEALAMQRRLAAGGGSVDTASMATTMNSLAQVLQDEGKFDKAEDMAIQALELRRRVYGDADSTDVAASLSVLSNVYQARSRFDEAEPRCLAALEMEQRLHGDGDSRRVAVQLQNLAYLHRMLGRYKAAEERYREAVAMLQRLTLGNPDSDLAGALTNLGVLYFAQSRYREAEEVHVKAVAMVQVLHGASNSVYVALALLALAQVYVRQSRLDEAEPLLTRASAMYQAVLGDGGSSDAAATVNLLADIHFAKGNFAAAESLLLQALEMVKRLHGDSDDCIPVAGARNNLARVYMAQQRYKEAEPLFRAALVAVRAIFQGADSSEHATALNNVAFACYHQKRYTEAEPLFQQALAMERRLAASSPCRSRDVGLALNNLAALYKAQGRLGEAEPLYVEAAEIWEEVYDGGDSPALAAVLANLAALHGSQGKHDKAEALYTRALAMRKRLTGGAANAQVAHTLNSLGLLHFVRKAYATAQPLLDQALHMYRELHPNAPHPLVARAYNNLASAHNAQGDFDKAEPLYAKALEMYRVLHQHEESSAVVAMALHKLAAARAALKRLADAEVLYQELLPMYSRLHGDTYTSTMCQAVRQLAEVLQGQHKQDEAVGMMRKAVRMYEHSGIAGAGLVKALRGLAKLYTEAGEEGKAAEASQRARRCSEEVEKEAQK